MKAEIRKLFATELRFGELPADADDFSTVVTAEIGFSGETRTELFKVRVVTTQFLDKMASYDVGRHTIYVHRFEWPLVERALLALVNKWGLGRDWNEIRTRLGRYGEWSHDQPS